MPTTSADHVATLTRYAQADAEPFVVRAETAPTRIIGADAPLGWDHGFTLDRHVVAGTAGFDPAGRVLFVHTGTVALTSGAAVVTLAEGDTMIVPGDLPHPRLTGDAVVFAVARTA